MSDRVATEELAKFCEDQKTIMGPDSWSLEDEGEERAWDLYDQTAARLRELEASKTDDPEADATDFAHPAWWRGHDQTVQLLCQKVHEILDGKDSGPGVSSEPWESVKRRLLALEATVEKLRAMMDSYMDQKVNGDDDSETRAAISEQKAMARTVLNVLKQAEQARKEGEG